MSDDISHQLGELKGILTGIQNTLQTAMMSHVKLEERVRLLEQKTWTMVGVAVTLSAGATWLLSRMFH